MDWLATRPRRKLLFAALYFSEGAPIGFLWFALPTRLRLAGLSLEQITWLTALLLLPWTFKWLWAPLLDVLRSGHWTFRNWIVTAQSCMTLTLLPLLWLDPVDDFQLMTVTLFVHALAAATQDVAIDALCISVTVARERGEYNGWMQAGMLLGRASMGGGALVIGRYVGDDLVVAMLIGLTASSMLLVYQSQVPFSAAQVPHARAQQIVRSTLTALSSRQVWLGLWFAAVGGAAFKSTEVIYGPWLVDRGYDRATIGWFSAGPMIGAMIAGALIGGRLADRFSRRGFVAAALVYLAAVIGVLSASDAVGQQTAGVHLLIGLVAMAFGIGWFTAASYALLMDLTDPALAAAQFSAFMGATNGCESWSSYTVGRLIPVAGYPAALTTMSLLSLLALPALTMLRGTLHPAADESER